MILFFFFFFFFFGSKRKKFCKNQNLIFKKAFLRNFQINVDISRNLWSKIIYRFCDSGSTTNLSYEILSKLSICGIASICTERIPPFSIYYQKWKHHSQAWDLFRVKNKDIQTISVTPFSFVFIAIFEQILHNPLVLPLLTFNK